MDLSHKLEYLYAHIRSISRHDDEDADVRKHMLDQAVEYVAAEKVDMDARNAERIAQLMGEGSGG